MKKIVLMLLALVVFGNVLANLSDFTMTNKADLKVKSVQISRQSNSNWMIEFVGSDGAKYQCRAGMPDRTGGVNYTVEDLKFITSILLSAKANGNDIDISAKYINEYSGVHYYNFINVIVK